MTQDEKWQAKYDEVMEFIKTNKRNPSKYRIEEHNMLNWLKANRKALNAGRLKSDRVEKFKELLAMMEQYRRKNQYEYPPLGLPEGRRLKEERGKMSNVVNPHSGS